MLKMALNDNPIRLAICPECGPVFQANGWDRIHTRWHVKYEQKGLLCNEF